MITERSTEGYEDPWTPKLKPQDEVPEVSNVDQEDKSWAVGVEAARKRMNREIELRREKSKGPSEIEDQVLSPSSSVPRASTKPSDVSYRRMQGDQNQQTALEQKEEEEDDEETRNR
jgi:hypothetical protein